MYEQTCFVMRNTLLTKHSFNGEVWTIDPNHGQTCTASSYSKYENKPPPSIQIMHAADQSAKEQQVCQFDGE